MCVVVTSVAASTRVSYRSTIKAQHLNVEAELLCITGQDENLYYQKAKKVGYVESIQS